MTPNPHPASGKRDYKLGVRHGIQWAITWLHERAGEMNDSKAKTILNTAAFNMGVEKKGEILEPASGNGDERAANNTDREIWRGPDEGNGGFYADSLFITECGGLGIQCGGHVRVLPIREWFKLSEGSGDGKMRAGWESDLSAIIGKLSAAALQISPNDDQIIADHVRDSVALLLQFRHKYRATPAPSPIDAEGMRDCKINGWARMGYEIFRGGFRKDVPPAWDDLLPYVRDACYCAAAQAHLNSALPVPAPEIDRKRIMEIIASTSNLGKAADQILSLIGGRHV